MKKDDVTAELISQVLTDSLCAVCDADQLCAGCLAAVVGANARWLENQRQQTVRERDAEAQG